MRTWLERPPDYVIGGGDWRVTQQAVCDECAEPGFHYEPHGAAPNFETPAKLVPVHEASSSSQFRADLVWTHDPTTSFSRREGATLVECDVRHEMTHEVGSWA